MPLLGEEEDPFWRVQLVNNTDEARRPFASEAPRSDYSYQDHALPVGTEVTDESLAGVLGREHEVCVPVTSSIISNNAGDDGDDRGKRSSSIINNSGSSNSNNNNNNNSSGSSDENNSRAWLGQALVLKLRQVNGDGVMSGVGGDVWCAALLLSAWLLENPEVVRGLDVLELGSGLGLCGITAGYLAKSITLTDYVDELLVNLRHNIEANRVPRVVSTVAPGKPIENRRSRSGQGGRGGGGGADGAQATVPQRRRPELHQGGQQKGGRQQDRQKQQQQQQQQQQHTPDPEHPQHLNGSDALLQEPMTGTSSSRRRRRRPPIPHDCAAPVDTAGEGGGDGGPVRIDDHERRRLGEPPVRLATATASDSVVLDGGKGLLPPPVPPPQRTPLLPLSRACVRVRKLDWTTYAGDGEARRASGEAAGGGGWWWDDRGPDTNQSGAMAPAGSQLLESDSLRCDVAVGSALVYSPHHACVADVLSHLFAEDGGCRAAYVVQLSTRPGFDDFLHRLGACGLRYRLERISTVLPAAILNEIRRSAHGAVTGGPVTRATDPAVARDEDGDDETDGVFLQHCDNDNDSGSDGVGGQQGEASGFDEFVLCTVFRPGDL